MSTITTKDGIEIFYKDWGPKNAQPIVFHHGWPLSADDWDTQMLYFLDKGYRVIAHDRRGHGRSTQVERRSRHGSLRRRRRRRRRASRPEERRPYRPLDRRRRGDALRRAARPAAGPRRQAGADRRRAADHGEDAGQSRRPADRGVRRLAQGSSPPTARSSISISRAVPSTASTGRARSRSQASSRTGGGRA